MSARPINLQCSHCSKSHTQDFDASINIARNPELKEKVLSGEYFTWTCPHCGRLNLITEACLYHDPEDKLMILLSPAPVSGEDLPDGYVGRVVSSAGELIEKVKIHSYGLDDVTMELCKYVTLREISKDVKLRFVGIHGADSEMTFTYPENGEMQMIAVGFNVYEDCAGILTRNPSIKEAARTLCRVDSDWLSKYFA